MKVKRIYFKEVEKAVLVEEEIDPTLSPTEVLIKTHYSGISSGTEGAGYAGYGSPKPPTTAGSSNVGEIIAVGKDVKDYAVGDIVISWCNHDSIAKCDINPREYGWNGFRIGPKVPSEIPEIWAAVVYHFSISMSAVRQSRMSIGDDVLVVGAGMIGLTAAQNFAAAGSLVMIADLSEQRLATARKCGITRAFNPKNNKLSDIVMKETQGRKLHHCILAIEGSSIVRDAVDCMRVYGNITLLGGYRKETIMDIAPVFERMNSLSLRIQGAHGLSYPIAEKPYLHDTINGNYRQILELMKTGKLKPEPLITPVSPADCQQVYQDIVYNKDKYLGCVFDWSKVD